MASAVPCGPDIGRYVAAISEYERAGYDEIYIGQIGPDQDAFFEFWTERLAGELEHATKAAAR